MHEILPKRELAKVFVRRNEEGTALVGKAQDPIVVDSRLQLTNIDDAMAGSTKRDDDARVDVLVGDQIHGTGPLGGVHGDRIDPIRPHDLGGEPQGGTDIRRL